MNAPDLKPIPIPPAQRLRQAKTTLLPALVFIGALAVITVLWKERVAAPTMVGQADGLLSNVSSHQAGMLAGLRVGRFQKVRAGEVLASVLVADPKLVEASLAVIRSEIETMRTDLLPVIPQKRYAVDYAQLRLGWMRQRADLGGGKVNLQLAEVELWRTEELFKDKIVPASTRDFAKATHDALKDQVEELNRLVTEGEATFKSLAASNPADASQQTGDPLHAAIAAEEAKLRLMEAQLSPLTLRAPIDGTVTAVYFHSGESVTPGQPIVTIAADAPTRIIGYIRQPMGIEPNAYVNGRDDGAGSWTDLTHPAGATGDGQPAFARLTALAFLRAAGLVTWTIPEFDNCLWDPAGAYVEVWSSAGAVTTTRLARAEAALPATYPHWTTVMGFQINGAPAQNTSIVAGRVRITRNGGGAFISSDVLTFGDGGATGMVKFPQDAQNATWKNLPIVDLGIAGLDGLPVRPVPSAAVLANTLPAVTSFATVAGQLTRFKDLASWPTTGGKLTFAIDMTITSFAAASYLVEMENTHISCQVATDGRMFLTVKDSAATALLSSVQIGALTVNTRFDLVIAVDLAALTCWTSLNGATTARTLPANSGNLASAARKVAILSRASGTTGNVIGTVFKAELWNDCVSGGGRPASDTLLRANGRIVGPAAVANAHPWKLGGNTA